MPTAPDLEAVHDLLKPTMLIPMHGEHRHLREHAKIAMAKGIQSEVATNGTMLDITGSRPKVVEYIEAGRTYLDGNRLIGALDGVVRDGSGWRSTGMWWSRSSSTKRMCRWAMLGSICRASPFRAARKKPLGELIEDELAEFLERAPAKLVANDSKLEDGVRRVVRQLSMEEIGKKPEVSVIISRLMAE